MRLIDADKMQEDIVSLLETEWGYEGLRDDVAEIFKKIPTIKNNADKNEKWISIKERMPDNSGSYIVATDRGAVCTARYWENPKRWNSAKMNAHIVAWMPLPAPPEQSIKKQSLKARQIGACDFCNVSICNLDKGEAHDFRLCGDTLCYFDSNYGWEGVKIKYCPMCGAKTNG